MSIVKVVLLAFQVGFARADVQCSDSLGNCPTPRASLMQLKTLKQKQQLQTTFGSQLASFQKFTDEMIAKYGKGDDDETSFTDPTILAAVKTVLDFIEEMYKSLLGYHEGDDERAKACMQNGNTCEQQHLDEKTVTYINQANSTANRKHVDFLTCMTDRATACGTENTHCTRYDKYRQQTTVPISGGFVRGDGSEPQYLPDCVTEGHFSELYIKAPAEGTPTEVERLKEMEECLVKTNEWLNGRNHPQDPTSADFNPANVSQHDGLFPHYENCDRTKDECEGLHEKCEADQKTFETSYCGYEMWWDSKCGSWKSCFDGENTVCSETTCPQIKTNVLGRKADNETGMRLECLLQVLFGKLVPGENGEPAEFADRLPGSKRADALKECTSTTYILTSWDIDCNTGDGVVPSICAATCPADPGDEVFLTSYYYDKGLSVEAPKPHDETNGVNKNIFPTETACELLKGHHSYNCGVSL